MMVKLPQTLTISAFTLKQTLGRLWPGGTSAELMHDFAVVRPVSMHILRKIMLLLKGSQSPTM